MSVAVSTSKEIATSRPLSSILSAHHFEKIQSHHAPNSVNKVDSAMLDRYVWSVLRVAEK